MELNKCLKRRGDEINRGWMEVLGGEFTTRPAAYDDDDSHIKFSMVATDWVNWKYGLLIDGVRIQPMET